MNRKTGNNSNWQYSGWITKDLHYILETLNTLLLHLRTADSMDGATGCWSSYVLLLRTLSCISSPHQEQFKDPYSLLVPSGDRLGLQFSGKTVMFCLSPAFVSLCHVLKRFILIPDSPQSLSRLFPHHFFCIFKFFEAQDISPASHTWP